MVENYKEIINKYFEETSFVEANINSFNNFMEKDIQKIINEVEEIVPTITPTEAENFKIKFGKVSIQKPEMIEADGSRRKIFPIEARLRKLTYSATISVEVNVYINNTQRDSFVTEIRKIPVMLKSKFCHLHGLNVEDLMQHGEDPYDYGGYFILNGNERVLVTIEDLLSNKLFVEEGSANSPTKYQARLFSEKGSYRVPHTIEQMKDGIIYLTFTRFRRVPIIAVIKALGLVKDQEIVNTISKEKRYDSVFMNLMNTVDLKTEDEAVDFLAKKIGLAAQEQKLEKTREQLDKYLLPHLGIDSKNRIIKAYNLCKMIKRFLAIAEDGVGVEDKDHLMNKRLKLSGDLLADFF